MARETKCGVCGSTDLRTRLNVGWDIDPEGEENQHEDHCVKCSATRLWGVRYSYAESRSHEWAADWVKEERK